VLVNVERVKEIHPQDHGDYLVVLSNGTQLRGSRKFRDDFRICSDRNSGSVAIGGWSVEVLRAMN
jgi:hypothetical protein